MSDAVTISLIAAVGAFTSAVLGMVNNAIAQRNSTHLAQAKDAIVTLEKNTNSIKDELVRVTASSEFAKGLKQGTENAAK